MANFVIVCPACKKSIKASTGLFAKKKIKCSCGYLIDVNSETMGEDICPHCGNKVIYDRKNIKSAECPVCHNKIYSSGKMVKFTCPACKTSLKADKSAKTFTCPQCKTIIDVQARVAQEINSGKIGVIKWDMGQNDIFIYRHPIENFDIGSMLIVSEGQKAIFFRNGKGLDVFGPGRHILETQKLPLLDGILKFPTDAKLTFDSKVYFIRTNRLNVKWGVPEIQLRNPGMNFYVDIGMSGSMDVQLIEDTESARKLLYMIIGTSSGVEHDKAMGAGEIYSTAYIAEKFRDVITTHFSDLMSNIVIENQINVLDIDSKKIIISNILRKNLNYIFEEYGLEIPQNHFNLTTIKIHNSDDVNRWKQQEVDKVIKIREEVILKEEAEARKDRIMAEELINVQRKNLQTYGQGEDIKTISKANSEAVIFEAQGDAEAIRLKGQAMSEAYLAQAMSEAEEMKAKGYSYNQETSRLVGMEAMKNGLPGTGNGTNNSAAGSFGGMVGNMVGIGIGMGVMEDVAKKTKDIINTSIEANMQQENKTQEKSNKTTAWNCKCGKSCITSKFCPDCGSERPNENKTWTCSTCGTTEIISNFCPNCGRKKGNEK